MTTRTKAGLFLVLASGGILFVHEVIARPAAGFPAQPISAPRALHRTAPLIGRSAVVRRDALRPPFSHRRRSGFIWQGVWSTGAYYEPYGSTGYNGATGDNGAMGYGAPYNLPPPMYPGPGYPIPTGAAAAKRIIYVLPYRRGCNAQTETLPWRDGSERSIRVVRC